MFQHACQNINSCAATEPDLVEDAVKYIIFLVDANRLFDTALGMYDFSLVLMIAQHAQKASCEPLNLGKVIDLQLRIQESIFLSSASFVLWRSTTNGLRSTTTLNVTRRLCAI